MLAPRHTEIDSIPGDLILRPRVAGLTFGEPRALRVRELTHL